LCPIKLEAIPLRILAVGGVRHNIDKMGGNAYRYGSRIAKTPKEVVFPLYQLNLMSFET
jgi:hypothetical protein